MCVLDANRAIRCITVVRLSEWVKDLLRLLLLRFLLGGYRECPVRT